MIIKGKARARSAQLASHLLRTDQNERIEVREYRGILARDLRGALDEIEAYAAGSRSTKPFYHASMSPPADRPLTPEQWRFAIDTLEARLGFTGQPRIVVVHNKSGREHVHVVWSRIDLDRGRAIHDSWNYLRHEQVARELERAFGHDRVQGAFVERDGKPRPERTPGWREQRQAERSGIHKSDVTAELTEIWRATRTGAEFRAGIEKAGYMLARGDQRTFVVLDPAGDVHAVARRIQGVRTSDVRERLAEIGLEYLPSVSEARAEMAGRLERLKRRQRSNTPPAPPTSGWTRDRHDPEKSSHDHRSEFEARLAATLYDQAGYIQMTEDAFRHMRHRTERRSGDRETVADRYYAKQIQAWQLERAPLAPDRDNSRDSGRDR